MSTYNDKALLSQKEIDILVNFLIDLKQSSLQNSVLTQDSIDKLVQILLNSDMDLLKLDNENINNNSNHGTVDTLSNLIQYDNKLTYELSFEVIDNKVDLLATHPETSTTLHITPKSLELMSIVEDKSYWGCCIDPNLFDKIATVFHFKYKRKTLDSITKLFVEKMYGTASVELPNIYHPSILSVSQNLI
ncbi:hypothetical protein [Anaerosporobacter sp.]